MIFDDLGLPKDTGATDWLDSSRLAGLMVVFDWPQKINLRHYLHTPSNKPTRHISDTNTKNFSRDQLVPLAAGLAQQPPLLDTADIPKGWRAANGDLLSPSQRNHLRLCKGGRGSKFGFFWLKIDILWSAYVQPMAEPNQLICMLMVAGPKYVKMWKHHNKKWKNAIRGYWSEGSGAWRNEPELAIWIIEKLEAV